MNIKKIIKRILRIDKEKQYLEKLKLRGFKVGLNFNMYGKCIDWGHCYLIEIGDDVTITNCTILAHDASMKKDIGYSRVGKVKIGSRVFIGWGSIVLPNTIIGNDVIIGAGTVVTRNIPNDSIVVGNPGRIIGKKSDFIERHKNYLKQKPVYNTYWPDKTKDEINQMIIELQNQDGYDI